jgi:hypothetical protein
VAVAVVVVVTADVELAALPIAAPLAAIPAIAASPASVFVIREFISSRPSSCSGVVAFANTVAPGARSTLGGR